MPLTIRPDLYSLIPPLSEDEYQQLAANLLAHGCRDPLVVWQEEQCVLDGHNRLELCERHGLTYDVRELSLSDLDAAKIWVIANQLGRRNLTPEQVSYLRGQKYHAQKQRVGRPDGEKSEKISELDTAQALAVEHKVTDRTIRNDAAFATAVDTIVAAVPEARQTILARETKLTREGVAQLAELARTDEAAAQAALTDIQAAPTVKEARKALTRHVGAAQGKGPRTQAARAAAVPEADEQGVEGYAFRLISALNDVRKWRKACADAGYPLAEVAQAVPPEHRRGVALELILAGCVIDELLDELAQDAQVVSVIAQARDELARDAPVPGV
jgi:hypothetical protein